MAKINQYKAIVFWLVCLPFLGNSQDSGKWSQKYSVTKTKSFKVSKDAMVDIDNKYGDIYFTAWEKDSIKIVVNTTMKAKSVKGMNKLKSRINIDIRGNMGYVMGKTVFGKNDGSLTGTIRQKADRARLLLQSQNVTVNYTVYYPKSTEIKVANKYGNVYLPDVVDKLNLKVSHGDVRGHTVNNAKVIQSSYGNVYFKSIIRGQINISYGDLFLIKSDVLSIQSKSSVVNLEEVNQLNIASKSDRYIVEKVNSLIGKCSYSNVVVRELTSNFNINTRYGSVTLDQINKEFKNLSLSGSYSDYLLTFESGASCKFNLSLENSKDFTYSQNSTSIISDSTTDEIRLVNGTIGGSTSNSYVNIKSKNAYLRFRQL